MRKSDLSTPATIVDAEKLKRNILDAQQACACVGKRLVPMTKTHKSSYIARLQLEAGAAGLLVGSLLEAERFAALRPGSITFAYPFLGERNLERMFAVSRRIPIVVSLDSLEVAAIYEDFCARHGVSWPYLLIVDVGLHRFGVEPALAGETVRAISRDAPHLAFRGISSHPGQVYAASDAAEVLACAREEEENLTKALKSVLAAGFPCGAVESGSTPTLAQEVQSALITAVRPGNYVYYDVVQTTLGAPAERCALTVLSSVLARRGENRWVIDAGSKCLGLDKGAHGNARITCYGAVVGHDELSVVSLSEEVGILESSRSIDLAVGDRIEIIPNHSCSAANLTSRILLCEGEEVTGFYEVDARESTFSPEEVGRLF